jgi:flagellar biosynthetic protein FliR
VIAALSRTLPQMNVLVLGFQVKSIATLVLLPVVLAWSSAAILRILRLALEATARMA